MRMAHQVCSGKLGTLLSVVLGLTNMFTQFLKMVSQYFNGVMPLLSLLYPGTHDQLIHEFNVCVMRENSTGSPTLSSPVLFTSTC